MIRIDREPQRWLRVDTEPMFLARRETEKLAKTNK